MNLQGTYTRKRDGLTCSYRAECTEWGTDVAWSADVYVGERLVSAPSGKLVLVPVAAVELEHAVRHAVEQSIESSDSIRSEAR
ncbi:MAG TPA: hypothetical protein VED47_00480 [Burkholderiaceae bacterium]|nr:hypothetical protein [Burkholderiaceae bacterium]